MAASVVVRACLVTTLLFEEGGVVRALVVDDSKVMRLVLGRMLEELGFEVASAADGAEALLLMEAGPVPDVCVVDWNMPVMDGVSFVQAVRADRRFADVALMMVSSEGDRPRIVRALAAGADEYVVKPFTGDVIADKIALLGLLRDVSR